MGAAGLDPDAGVCVCAGAGVCGVAGGNSSAALARLCGAGEGRGNSQGGGPEEGKNSACQ